MPELQHSTLALKGVPIAPIGVATRFGDTAVIDRVVDDQRAEVLVRALATARQNLIGVADHPAPVSALRDAVIPGAISYAERLGACLREARAEGRDVAQAVADAGGGEVRFRGRVSDLTWETQDGFTVGEVCFAGEGTHAGSTYRLRFKNEHIAAWRDDALDVTVPDLICVLTADGEPATNPEYDAATTYTVVVLPAPPIWTTAKGLALFGPRAFGLAEEWVSFTAR